MKTKLFNYFKTHFNSLSSFLRTSILLLVPLITLFSVMSDRNPYNIINIGLYAVEIVLILIYVWKYKKFRFDILTFCIVLFLICILISQITNNRLSQYPTTILLLGVFAIVFYQFLVNEENKEVVYKLIVIGGILFAIYFIYWYFVRPTGTFDFSLFNFDNRLGEDFSDQNDLAKYLAIFALLSLIDIYKERRFWKILPTISLLIFIYLVLVTGSVSNLLCLTIVGILAIIFCSKRKNRLYVLIGIVALGAILYGMMQLPFMKYFKTRIDGIFNSFFDPEEKVDGSASDRIKLFLEGFRLFLNRPFLGFGYDQVQYYTHGAGQFSHSNVVEVLASFGIVGFLAFETLIVYPIYYAFKNDYYKKNSVLSLLYLFVFQFFLIIFRKKIEYMLIPLGFSCIIENSRGFEVTFNGFKPNITFISGSLVHPKKTILLVSNAGENVFELQGPKFSEFFGEDFVIKTCTIGEQISNIKSDFNIIPKRRYFFIRKMGDVLDEVNPSYVFSTKDLSLIVAKASLGKNIKIAYRNDDLSIKRIKHRKVYQITEGEKPIDKDEKKIKKQDYHIIYLANIDRKTELKKLIVLLR